VTAGPLGGGGGQSPGEDAGQPGHDVAGQGRVEQDAFIRDREAEDLAGE
jgi:hypothetical protein